MNVVIIGCGYVGTAIARYWHQELGFVVTATTTTPDRVSRLEALGVQVAIVHGNDLDGLQTLLQDQDTVLLSIGAKSSNLYEETYLQTAQTLVSALQESPSVRQLIYTGSYSVYGDRDGAWVDETSPLKPTNHNAEILAQTEQVLLSAASDRLKVSILRLGGIYGPNRELVKIFSRVFGTTRPGRGEDVTNWIHLDDIVAAIEFVRKERLEGIYNLVDDAHLTSRELLHSLSEKHNSPYVIWDAAHKSVRPYNARVSNQKIKNAGYQLIHPQMIF